MSDIIRTAYNKVFQYITRHGYRGYDPYDGNNTRYGLLKKYYPSRVLLTYLNKFSPLNLRPLLGISRSESNQALAFLMRAILTHKPEIKNTDEFVQNTLNHFLEDTQKHIFGEHTWYGLGFPVQMLKPKTPFNHTMPDAIATEACALAIMQYAEQAGKMVELVKYITGAAKFFLKHHLVQSGEITFFKYYPDSSSNTVTYNASIIATAYLLEANEYEMNPEWQRIAKEAVRFVIKNQYDEGYWNYGINLQTGNEKKQIDFHQGFILDAILKFIQKDESNSVFYESYKKGLEFYYQKQFLPNGQGIYRYPRKWPVNIHNQAQGIITFTRAAAAGFGEEYHQFALTIAQWTIQNMQDKDGHFYFLKYPLFTNKIPYIRWSDAAMAYALSVLLEYEQKKH